MRSTMLALWLRVAPAVLVAGIGVAHAAGDPGAPSAEPPGDPVLARVAVATRARDWTGAAVILRAALEREPGNAEYHNLYAYALRKGPNPDMALVFRHYEEALRIDPELRDAHEYIGEAYLQVENLAKAKEHLAELDRLCILPCDQYTELKEAVAIYERAHRR